MLVLDRPVARLMSGCPSVTVETTSLSPVLFNDGLHVVVDICFASFLYRKLTEHIAAGGGSELGRGKGRIARARDV